MAIPTSYLTSAKNLGGILNSIVGAQAPEKFTTRFLESLDYKTSSDRLAKDTETIAFWAVMNLGTFGTLSMEESVLQLWYLACHAPTLDPNVEPYNRVLEVFGDLRLTPRAARLAAAKRVLAEHLANVG